MVVESVNEWAFSMAHQVKNLTGEEGSISESGKSPGGGNGNTLQDSCLKKIPGTKEQRVTKNWT